MKQTERLAEIPQVVEGVSLKTPAELYAQLLSHGGSSATEMPRAHMETHEEYSSERREVSLEDWSAPRHGWIKYAAAALVVAAAAAGGWFFYGRTAFASRAAAALPPAAAKPVDATLASSKAASPIVKDSAAVQTATEQKPPPPPEPAPRPARSSAPADDGEPAALPSRRSTSALPTVNMDRITRAIDDSARARVDSAGRTLNVNPPTFNARPAPAPPK